MISLQTGKPIDIKLPHVYRYMDKKFIDLFFDKGILRLSSFQRFRKYSDEIRGDKREGGGALTGKSDKEGFQFHVMTQVGKDAYIFCTSVIESKKLLKIFDCNSCFRIIKPLEFSIAVSNAIPGFKQSFQGFCNYREYRIIAKIISGLSINDFTDNEGEIIIGGPKMMQRTNQILGSGTDLLFLKEKKYQDQSEYRFVWTINTHFFDIKKHIDIECKEAIQYCERI